MPSIAESKCWSPPEAKLLGVSVEPDGLAAPGKLNSFRADASFVSRSAAVAASSSPISSLPVPEFVLKDFTCKNSLALLLKPAAMCCNPLAPFHHSTERLPPAPTVLNDVPPSVESNVRLPPVSVILSTSCEPSVLFGEYTTSVTLGATMPRTAIPPEATSVPAIA